jgi:hypothetical protein
MVPASTLAYMLTQKGASLAEHAMAPASLKQDALSRQEATEAEFIQAVTMGWEEGPAQPNQAGEEEKMQDEEEVQDTGKSVWNSWLALVSTKKKISWF